MRKHKTPRDNYEELSHICRYGSPHNIYYYQNAYYVEAYNCTFLHAKKQANLRVQNGTEPQLRLLSTDYNLIAYMKASHHIAIHTCLSLKW